MKEVVTMARNALSLEKIQSQIEYWQKVKRVWEQPIVEDDFYTFVYQTYIHTSSVAETANIVNEKGFRKTSPSGNIVLYYSNDISEIIREHDIENSDLQSVCRDIFLKNARMAGKIWG